MHRVRRRPLSIVLRPTPPPVGVGLLVAVAFVAVETLVAYPLKQVAPATSLGVVYLIGVLVVSTAWGSVLGAITSIASALAFNFFHIPPTGRFTIAIGQNWVALGVFLAVALLASSVADLARARAAEADERRREADLAAEMARLLLRTDDLRSALPAAAQRLAQALELPSAAIELERGRRRRAARRVPAARRHDPLGTLLVPADTPEAAAAAPAGAGRPVARGAAGGRARARGALAEVVETAALRRSDVVKTALLRAVSHDLRSPLTAIVTAAGSVGSPTLERGRARRAGRRHHERGAAAVAARRPAAGPLAPRGRRGRAAARLGLGRRGDPQRDRERRPAAGRLRARPRPRPAAPARRRRPDRAGDRERARQRASATPAATRSRSAPGRSAGGCSCASSTAARASRPPSASGSSSRSTAPGPTLRSPRLGPRPRDRPRVRHGQRRPDLGRVAARPGDDVRDGVPARAAGPRRRRCARPPGERARPRVLVCDDEPQILRALKIVLRDAGFELVAAATADEALDAAALRPPDAAIIDLVLPDESGIEVCRRLREWSEMPIIVLSAIGEEDQKVLALEAGADDYLTKPFSPRELIARLQAVLRRAGARDDEPTIVADGLEIDLAARVVRRDGEEIHLTPIELDLLRTLVRNRGRLMTHRALLTEVWGPAVRRRDRRPAHAHREPAPQARARRRPAAATSARTRASGTGSWRSARSRRRAALHEIFRRRP